MFPCPWFNISYSIFCNLRQDHGKSKRKSKDTRKKGKGKKASFKVHRGSKGLKSGKKKDSDGDLTYKGVYDLSPIPPEAHPDMSKPNKGSHSYTLSSLCGSGSIEVLLRHNAFFVKKLVAGAPGPLGQVSFARFDGAVGAWQEAKRRAGF